MFNFLLVAIGGSIGASIRHIFYIISKSYLSANYLFINTLLINITGSFFIGYMIILIGNKNLSQDFIKYFIIIGILGSFTTYSTFSLETIQLLIDKKFLFALLNIFFTITLCLFFTFLGLNLNKFIN